MTTRPNAAPLNAAWLHSHPAFTFRVTRNVFGTEVDLGRAIGNLPDVSVVQLPSLLITPTPVLQLKLIAKGDGDMRCRLLAPYEDPPEGALEVPPPE
jgi:hypothetical protein